MTRRNNLTNLNQILLIYKRCLLANFIKAFFVPMIFLITIGVFAPLCLGQSASTGALSGMVSDPTGAVVPGVRVKVINEATGETRTVTSDSDGKYVASLLPPGSYKIEAEGKGFKLGTRAGIGISVTETTSLDIQLEVGSPVESVTVNANAAVAQTESSTLGRVVDEKAVVNLPLVTRNYTQILGLSPGVTANVNNAAAIGRGSGGADSNFLATGTGTYVHGARSYDNNFQMNGVTISDLQGSGGSSGGFAIPNPDTLQGFKVQTALYDASFGRNAGANVNVTTKGGGNAFHGTVFEFFRNEALNANDFFFNRAGRKRGVLRQNQFGFTLGGPIVKDKLLFFTSYQGTRQTNGIVSGGSASVLSPPLTNDRSAAALGTLFAGRTGSNGGVAILANGSNINPVALRLLQAKNADGSFLLPTPQTISSSGSFDSRGSSVFSNPSRFNENQYMINLDFLHTDKSKFEGRYFSASSDQIQPLPRNIPGFPLNTQQEYRNLTVAHTYLFSSNLFNEARFGYHRTDQGSDQGGLNYADFGINASTQVVLDLVITGSYDVGGGNDFLFSQNNFTVQDTMTYIKGSHTLRFGGGINKGRINLPKAGATGRLTFNSFPDFLLGMSAAQNGTAVSHIGQSFETIGIRERDLRATDGFVFFQDDFKLRSRVTLNLGVRYERISQFSEALGRGSNFRFDLANPNPPAGGSFAGFVLASNYSDTTPPAGVTILDKDIVVDGNGQNTFGPRVGFAWQILPNSTRLVLRGGYGIYYSRLSGQPLFQLVSLPPFSLIRQPSGAANPGATFANPFQLPLIQPDDFPIFVPYSPTTRQSVRALAPDYRPSHTHQISLNMQSELFNNILLEVGYVGTRGKNLLRTRSLNQAKLASVANPIRGETTNTVANIPLRVPIQGFTPDGIRYIETSAESWYNGLEFSVTRRLSNGLQLQGSYTFSKILDSNGASDVNSNGIGVALGDQNIPLGGYGRASYDRTHRFVLSYIYEFPIAANKPGFIGKVLGGWSLSGVTTIQSGQALTITATNSNNIYGITTNRVQLSGSCTYSQLQNAGAVNQRLTSANPYFKTSCFGAFPVIDGGRGFGNSGVGIVNGPGQNNSDIAVIKRTPMNFLREGSNLEFRVEFFNAFNTTQFSNPVTNFSSAAFGTITSTAVSPRIVQMALKFNF